MFKDEARPVHRGEILLEHTSSPWASACAPRPSPGMSLTRASASAPRAAELDNGKAITKVVQPLALAA